MSIVSSSVSLSLRCVLWLSKEKAVEIVAVVEGAEEEDREVKMDMTYSESAVTDGDIHNNVNKHAVRYESTLPEEDILNEH